MAAVVEPASTSTVAAQARAAASLRRWVRSRRPRTLRAIVAVAIALAAVIALAEIDRLIAGALSATGRSASLNGTIGPLALLSRESWAEWASSASRGSIGGWIIASILIDLALIAAYFWMAKRIISRMGDEEPRRYARTALIVLLGIEAAEFVVLLAGALLLVFGGGPVPADQAGLLAPIGPVAITEAVLGTLKCALVVLLAVFIVRDGLARRIIWTAVRRLAQALWLHRLSTVLVLALAVLTCIPTEGVLDQLPDLQRRWAQAGVDGTALLHMGWALVAIAVAVLCAWALGRARTRALASGVRGFDVTKVKPHRKHALWWLAPMVVWLVLWGITGWLTGAWLPGWAAIAFLAVPALVMLTYLPWWKAEWAVAPRVDRLDRARWAWLTGDAIAVAIPVIAGLGLVRSFTAPVFAGQLPYESGLSYPFSVVLLLLGLGMAVGSPWLLRWRWHVPVLLDPTVRVDADPVVPSRRRRAHLRVIVLGFAAGLVFLALIGLLPVQTAALFGAPALAVLLLTAWGAVLGTFTVVLQDHPPAPVFRFLRLRADPVLTLAITIPLIWAIIAPVLGADDPGLHGTRTGAVGNGDAAAARKADDSLEQQITDRLDRLAASGCTARVGDASFTPALVVVAEGGGIRAAYWTARALDQLRGPVDDPDCMSTSVLASSGVSGGSVGLAVAATERRSATELEALAGPDAVGTGAASLLVGDLVASVTGLRMPSNVAGEWAWRDRAALIEGVWVDSVNGLEETVALAASDRIGIPVLNSTDIRSKCKVLVSNGLMTEAGPPPVPPSTSGAGEAAPDTDAEAAAAAVEADPSVGCEMPATAPAASLPVASACFSEMEWATAAMLSARFAVITPAARMPGESVCGDASMQLVDGGYAEPTGLGTAADLAPVIADRIAAWNRDHPAADPIVPILVYLRNSAGYDLRRSLEDVTAEPLVPLVGYPALTKSSTEQALRQRATAAFVTIGEGDRAGARVIDEVQDCANDGCLPGLEVIVAPSTVPAVMPPLGWALSGFSIESLDRAMLVQTQPSTTDVPNLHTLRSLTED
ncbi:hypothetical protein [Agromyces sp. GXS1127]|uniref:hypothetical protein n=1 Tax=Agromyces sp. GXS1127 TaxID=3424181 RepID=UPI003D323707